VTDLTERLKPLGVEFVKRVDALSRKNDISPKYMWYVLLAERDLWPDMRKEYISSLKWAKDLAQIARAIPDTKGWQFEIPTGDSQVVIDLLLLEFGGWAFIELMHKKAHKILKAVLERYRDRFKKIYNERYDDANKLSDKDIMGALLIEMVRHVVTKNWRFDEGLFIGTFFRVLGYYKYAG